MSLLTVPSTYDVHSVVSPSVGVTTTPGAGLTWRSIGYIFEVTKPCTLTGLACLDPTSASLLGHAWLTDVTTGTSVSGTISAVNKVANLTYSLVPDRQYIASIGYKVASTYYSQRPMEYDYGTPDPRTNFMTFSGEQFMATPPSFIKYIRGTYIYSNDIEGPAVVSSLIHPTQVTAKVQLFITHTEATSLTTPDAPIVGQGIGQFTITLPAEWRVADMKEWSIQVSTSSDNAQWSSWGDLITLPPSTFVYTHSSVDTSKYYQYRYQVRQRVLESNWSEVTHAGAPTAGVAAPVQWQQTSTGDVVANTTGNITSTGGFVGKAVGAFYATANTVLGVNNSWTQITFQNELFDVSGWFTSSVYTPQIAGYYFIGGWVSGAVGLGNNAALLAMLYKNGAQAPLGGNFASATAQANLNPGAQATGTTIIYMNGSSDYLDLRYYAGTSGSWNMLNAGIYGHLIGTN